MKIIRISRKNHYLTIANIFLIVVAFIVGTASCSPVQYSLTISSTEGGEVTAPGEGIYTYNDGTVVNLIATPDAGYYFVSWTGDVDTIANLRAAATTIACDGDYSIIANFAEYIPMVAAGWSHTVGLRANGTVVAVGSNYLGQCSVGDWTDVTAVATGSSHTVRTKSTRSPQATVTR
jgi:hypothetical protein